ncbi:MAG TPA: alpha-amylase family protein [Thermomicrobiales bacterium]|jgi:amylosucrase|nr:alpha-amylase family protein [Thermomicrobiales bacterium]
MVESEPVRSFPPNPRGIPETADRRAAVALRRLRPKLETQVKAVGTEAVAAWPAFARRLDPYFPTLYRHLAALYGGRDDLSWHLERLLLVALDAWLARSPALRARDDVREGGAWFTDHRLVAGVCYVDRFSPTGDIRGLIDAIPYIEDRGIGLLHLMPLFAVPPGNSDGGYAVSDYRRVRPDLGTVDDLRELADRLHEAGIALALDFVFNHTASDHPWAEALRADPSAIDDEDRNPYLMFPDRTIPDQYDTVLREIFPENRPGSFSYDAGLNRWVWTTFNDFQWDLDYTTPGTFTRMAGEMLALANLGADVLRLDAVAFAWKRPGTVSESLPQVHDLVRAYNALARIAAPSLAFLSEAIVHPDEVVSYIHPDEAALSYNPLQMALGWEALATRQTRLLRQSLSHRLALPAGTAWLNYVRSHDDIGWTFDDGDAGIVGINGFDHRQFLNRFYTGRFPGSFARGLPFQENPRTGDARVTGTTAALAGLEKALTEEGPAEVQLAVGRILALYGLAFALPGMPLIYLGDEIAMPNDHGYRDDPSRAMDSRWANRPVMDWQRAAIATSNPGTIEGLVLEGIARLTLMRQHPGFADPATAVLWPEDETVFAFTRGTGPDAIVVLASLSERPAAIPSGLVRDRLGDGPLIDLLDASGDQPGGDVIHLAPYQQRWLTRAPVAPRTPERSSETGTDEPVR